MLDFIKIAQNNEPIAIQRAINEIHIHMNDHFKHTILY